MLRRALPAILVSSACAIGCNLLTGVGNLEATDDAGLHAKQHPTSSSSSSSSSSSGGAPIDAAPNHPIDAAPDGRADASIDASSPPPTTRDFNGHRYLIVLEHLTWPDAKAKAEERGGHLATIASAEENDFVRQLAKDSGLWADDSVYGGWLGAQRIPADGGGPADGWTWVTGEPFDYTSWLAGEPNNSGDSEMYLGFYQSNADGLWNDWNESGDGNMPGFILELDEIPAK